MNDRIGKQKTTLEQAYKLSLKTKFSPEEVDIIHNIHGYVKRYFVRGMINEHLSWS
jgi:hypothetical protein